MFVLNFWGTSRDEALAVVLQRIKHGQHTIDEVIKYYAERMLVEAEYIRRLDKVGRSVHLGRHETGLLKVLMDLMTVENQHGVDNCRKQLKLMEDTCRQLKEFAHLYDKRTNKILGHMSKLLHKLTQAEHHLDHEQTKFRDDCGLLKGLRLQVQTTWGKELEKYQVKQVKAQQLAQHLRKLYQMAITTYNELMDIYKKDWAVALLDLYKLELERIQLLKVNCFNWCNVIATYCVDQDATVDVARTSFAQVNPATDLLEFTKAYGTGNNTLEHSKFVDYLNGEAGDNGVHTHKVEYKDPKYNPILSKPLLAPETNSHVHPGAAAVQAALKYQATSVALNDVLPPRAQAKRKPPQDYDDSERDENEVFSEPELRQSQGLSKYLEPTNYTLSNYSLASKRLWNLPRKGEKQLKQVQEQINRQLQPLTAPAPTLDPQPKVNIMKDFSVDFLLKALDDLNLGGTGDVLRYRKSVRRQQAQEEEFRRSQGAASSTRPKLDYIDDLDEVAVRYESLTFGRPKLAYAPTIHTQATDTSAATTQKFDPRKLKRMVKLPLKLYTDLRLVAATEMVDMEPVTRTKTNPADSRRQSLPYPSHDYAHDVDEASSLRPQAHKRHLMPAARIPTHTPVLKQPIVGKARAKYTFHPNPNPDPHDLNQKSEMFFRKGWTMYIIQRQEDDWYWAELLPACGPGHAGRVGLVPGNYLDEGGEEIFQG